MPAHRTHLLLVTLLLTLSGLAISLYQTMVLNIPLSPDSTDRIWIIDTNVTYEPREGRPAKVTLNIPDYDESYSLINERFISNNYGTMVTKNNKNRQVAWSIRRPEGFQSLYYRTTIHKNSSYETKTPSDETYAEKFIFTNPLEKLAAESLIEPIRKQSADIETFVSETVKRLNQQDNHNAQLLLDGDHSALHKAVVATRLLSNAHIPVELIHALPLNEASNVQPTVWMRCFDGNRRLYFNPENGVLGLPKNMLPWWRGTASVAQVKGGRNTHITFSVSSQEVSTLQLAQTEESLQGSLYSRFSLYNLPVQTQHVYHILLTVPLGVLVILVLRTFVGISTFGTFTPVLIALAFRETQLGWGIFLFTTVTALGLVVRAYLEHLRLLLLPRLGIVLTFVVIIMTLISLFSHNIGIERGLSVALFPMVILTMTIERISILWEERGANEALTAGAGSLLAAALSYLLMSSETISYVLFTFPGILLIVIAAMIVIGRYSGYRLSELSRFRAFLKEKADAD